MTNFDHMLSFYYGGGFDRQNWLLLVGIPLIIGLWAQFRVSSAFKKWGEVRASSNITGAEAAREILQAAQINDVEVVETNDYLGDHYDPTSKRLCLSTNVYNTPSVAALGIAAHETGHAIQHAKAYAPLKMRMAIVPVTQIASQMLPFIIFGGLFFHMTGLITLGIYCYLILLAFQLITLPVEFDASRRAKIILQQMGMVQPGPGSGWGEQSPERRRAHLCGGVYRHAGQPAVAHVRAGSALMPPKRPRKMNSAIALPSPRRLTDLLSSGLRSRVKPKRNAMEQPRSDEDKQLVSRTQEGDVGGL